MQTFTLYLIKDEFFNHYYHKSSILFDFFRTYHLKSEHDSYQKQFDFITNEIPAQLIVKYLNKKPYIKAKQIENTLRISQQNSSLNINIGKKEWKINCSSIHEAERLLFEELRSFHSTFFVLNLDYSQYGWLSPVQKEIIL